ncbi:MAG: hypothetical protein QXJ96_03265 [Candidatus Aenigmatarchaeota archaeon]|nr:hypothetical protein [Candidatus Aenigmarchaeota archaeon]
MRGKYLDNYETELLHKLKKKRHGIKYYGKILSEETVERNVEMGKTLFLKLKSIIERELAR